MWLQSIFIISLLGIIYPACVSAETPAKSAQAQLTEVSLSSFQNNQQTGLSPLQSKPQIIYQQALNYLLGRNGVDKSTSKAATLFKALAEQNWSSAQHMLGNMYYSGKGVEKNDLLAYKWLSLASKNNIQLARAIQAKRQRLHNKLQTSLSNQSLDKVEMWIAEWQPSNNKLQAN